MKPHVKLKLESTFQFPFFEAVGKPLPSTVTGLKTWQEAGVMCNSKKWEVCQLMSRNVLSESVSKRSWHRGQEWDAVTDELRPLILSFVDSLISIVPLSEKPLKHVKDSICWDIMFICLEEEYRDIVAPFFYIPVVEPWYAAGHFPCGWDGDEFSDKWDGVVQGGQLIVY
ncbi:MAG: hypothetical protein NTZ16_05345 [Verrucomicrobia bacterium]|nr:hypothetical protein [Verrucomicrobiota bacterium]